jgi:hypothetical protein
MTTISRTLTIRSISCGVCGILFGLESKFMDARKDDGASFYCPNGHNVSWAAANEHEQTEKALAKARSAELALRDQLSAAIREGELTRQALLRDRQRFLNGVCVCCNRSFENVRRHMSTQHPDFDVEKVATGQKFQCSCGESFTTLHGLRIHQGRLRREGWDKPGQSSYRAHLTRV